MIDEKDYYNWQQVGGVLSIPDGWFVSRVNFDAEPPYAEISRTCTPDKRIEIPKSLAYFLRTHFCGSEDMKKSIERGERHRIAKGIKELLGIG